jgi:hypothetical protein
MNFRKVRWGFTIVVFMTGMCWLLVRAEMASTKSLNPMFIEIQRPVYHFRHWMWSGIFPVDGGFIDDPHFIASQPTLLPEGVRQLLGDETARYQMYDINPFFEDETSQTVLVIAHKGIIYEYKVRTKVPLVLNVDMNIKNGILIKPFEYESNIGLISTDREVGFSFIELPLKKNGEIIFEDFNTAFSKKVISYLKNGKKYLNLKDALCSDPFLPNHAFYEKEFGPC